MARTSETGEEPVADEGLSDDALIVRFQSDPRGAWPIFLDRYADVIFAHLQKLHFDYDESMDRFAYVCEKLAEHDCRRLRSIRHTGRAGELTPWLIKVVERLCVNWLWSQQGRRRMFKAIERLPAFDQRVFELHFRDGLIPSAIHERLSGELHRELGGMEVYQALDRIFARLSPNKIWRLLSQLARSRAAVSLESISSDDFPAHEPVETGADPEQAVLWKERTERLFAVIDRLPPRERLIIHLRYEEDLEIAEIGRAVRMSEDAVRGTIGRVLSSLRTG